MISSLRHGSRPDRRLNRRLAVLVAFLGAMLVTASCGLRGANQFLPESEPGSIEPMSELEGVEVTVGSKNFTEGIILGKIAVIVLDVAGAEVEDKTNLAGSVAQRQALVSGDIDVAYDYTGTGWIVFLGNTDAPTDPDELYEALAAQDLEQNDVYWLEPGSLNNTYAFAAPSETSAALGITALSQIQDLPVEERTFCVESEFRSRGDGLEPMLAHYGVPLGAPNGVPAENISIFDTGVIYSVTDNGEVCNFGEVFESDGRILALDLTVLEDDLSYFPAYRVSLMVHGETYREHPEIEELFQPVTQALTTERMQELNALVDVEGQDPALVAQQFLAEEGFITLP